ncbi:hypothetical protein CKF54_06345 [Psittacicella hinzii]|uniref:DUF805 domain-containing protein n=1 Tax=Psittacicella hinzii TaxID=2028575 RepID=A0A3A1Y2T3_9GAMM|nr:DUF805 domain-containing protein [Psittacicella hinzii]RIY31616.1 hypothetical protein CKF54_06345 [Psittacicella hinzii]
MTVRPDLNQNLCTHFKHLFSFKASERRREFFVYNLFTGVYIFFAYLILSFLVVSLAYIYDYDLDLAVAASFSVALGLYAFANLAAAFRRVRDFGLPGLSIVILFIVLCALTAFFERASYPSVTSNACTILLFTFVLSLLALFPTKVAGNKYRNPKVFPEAEEASTEAASTEVNSSTTSASQTTETTKASQTTDAPNDRLADVIEETKEVTSQTAEKVADNVAEAHSTAEEKVEEAKETVASKVEEVKEAVTSKVEEAKVSLNKEEVKDTTETDEKTK